MNKMKVLSLFDGISCGMVALERANVPVERYVAYEIDDDAIKISENNYPQIEHKGDVFEAEYTKGEFDLLIGGSPCTYWSIARRDKHNRETTCSGLGWNLFCQYVRALKEAKPKYFLYENNYSMSKEIKEEITKILGVEPIMINSNLVSAQNRKRLYWTNIPNVTIPKDKGILFSDIQMDLPFRKLGKFMFGYYGDKMRIDKCAKITAKKANTLTTSKTHSNQYYLNEDKTMMRNLHINEYERLQTLPDNYTAGVKETSRYKAVGNGWTVDVIAHIFQGIPQEFIKKGDEKNESICLSANAKQNQRRNLVSNA